MGVERRVCASSASWALSAGVIPSVQDGTRPLKSLVLSLEFLWPLPRVSRIPRDQKGKIPLALARRGMSSRRA